MADNFDFTPGSGETGAAKNVGGVLYPQVIATEIDGTDTGLSTKLGALTETAPSTDTASSGLNGRLQRIAERLTTLIGSTIAVSGTFWQSVQPVSGTFWQTTQPVSLASVPSHAVTNAGTFAVQATEADGANTTLGSKADAKSTATDTTAITAMQVWKQISASVQAIATSIAGTLTATVSGSVTANAGTNLNTSALALETGGNLATLAGAVSSSKMATKAASGDFADGALVTLGAKTDAKSTATDTTSITIMQALKQVSASVQAIATSIAGTLTVATHAVTQSGTWTVATNADGTTGSAVPAKGLLVQGSDGTDARNLSTTTGGVLKVDMSGTAANSTAIKVDGSAVTQPVSVASTLNVAQVPAASGGPTVARIKAAASTNATSVKTSAGQIYGYALYNNTTSAKFFKVYNKASSPTVGTDTPAFTVIIPASGGANVSWDLGIPLGTGVAYAITGAVADSDTTSTAADDVHGVLLYK